MGYIQYDRNGKEVNPRDLQNKSIWCKHGERIELAFVRKFGKELGIAINPQKHHDPYAPDLVKGKQLGDLKAQNTPFFKADKLYGIDPSYAIVFNRKDLERYRKLYSDIQLYFWVEWHAVKFEMGSFVCEVAYLSGVYEIPFQKLYALTLAAPEHFYQQRLNDHAGNAKSSFVLDLRSPGFEKIA